MPKLTVTCPTCLEKYLIESHLAGKPLKCASPRCGRSFTPPIPEADVEFAEATEDEELQQRTAMPQVESQAVRISNERVEQIIGGRKKTTVPHPQRPKVPTPAAVEVRQDAVPSVAAPPVSQGQTSVPGQPIEESFASTGMRLFWFGAVGLIIGMVMPTFIYSEELSRPIHNADLATQKICLLLSSSGLMLAGVILRAASRKPISNREKSGVAVVIALLFAIWILPIASLVGMTFLQ